MYIAQHASPEKQLEWYSLKSLPHKYQKKINNLVLKYDF